MKEPTCTSTKPVKAMAAIDSEKLALLNTDELDIALRLSHLKHTAGAGTGSLDADKEARRKEKRQQKDAKVRRTMLYLRPRAWMLRDESQPSSPNFVRCLVLFHALRHCTMSLLVLLASQDVAATPNGCTPQIPFTAHTWSTRCNTPRTGA